MPLKELAERRNLLHRKSDAARHPEPCVGRCAKWANCRCQQLWRGKRRAVAYGRDIAPRRR